MQPRFAQHLKFHTYKLHTKTLYLRLPRSPYQPFVYRLFMAGVHEVYPVTLAEHRKPIKPWKAHFYRLYIK